MWTSVIQIKKSILIFLILASVIVSSGITYLSIKSSEQDMCSQQIELDTLIKQSKTTVIPRKSFKPIPNNNGRGF